MPINCPILGLTCVIKFHAKMIKSLFMWSEEAWSYSTAAQTTKNAADFCTLTLQLLIMKRKHVGNLLWQATLDSN